MSDFKNIFQKRFPEFNLTLSEINWFLEMNLHLINNDLYQDWKSKTKEERCVFARESCFEEDGIKTTLAQKDALSWFENNNILNLLLQYRATNTNT